MITLVLFIYFFFFLRRMINLVKTTWFHILCILITFVEFILRNYTLVKSSLRHSYFLDTQPLNTKSYNILETKVRCKTIWACTYQDSNSTKPLASKRNPRLEEENFNIKIILNILICCYYIFICIKASKLSENLQNNSQRKGG